MAIRGILPPVTTPDLNALRLGDASAWDEAFRWLWPPAFAVAQLKLQPFLPEDVEDVAIEALEEIVEKVKQVQAVEELRPLVASIAHNRAVSHLREAFAKKRGAGKTESLEAAQEQNGREADPAGETLALGTLDQRELATLLGQLQESLKPEQASILSDFFIEGLKYEQIASKRGVAVGSVGVYLKRGLEVLRKAVGQRPKLLKELESFLRCLMWL